MTDPYNNAELDALETKADPFASYDAQKLADDTASAEKAGVTVDQLRAARHYKMDVAEYAAYDSPISTLPDAVAADAALRAQRGTAA